MKTFKNVVCGILKGVTFVVVMAAVAATAVGLYSILDTSAEQSAQQIGINYVKEHKLTGDYEVVKDGPLQYHVDMSSLTNSETVTVGYELPWE